MVEWDKLELVVGAKEKVFVVDIPLFYGSRKTLWTLTRKKMKYINTTIKAYHRRNKKRMKYIKDSKMLGRSIGTRDIIHVWVPVDPFLTDVVEMMIPNNPIVWISPPKSTNRQQAYMNLIFSDIPNKYPDRESVSGKVVDGKTGLQPLDKLLKQIKRTGDVEWDELSNIVLNFFVLVGFTPNQIFTYLYENVNMANVSIMGYIKIMFPKYRGGLSASPHITSSAFLIKRYEFFTDNTSWTKKWDALYWNYVGKNHRVMRRYNRMSNIFISKWVMKRPAEKRKIINLATKLIKKINPEE